ncbi:AraC family transcriptional regulator [Riemerella columbina]|uniref:AraC family transcriptional regulator n=1 Tax=Riemerella columbina TaxID=103810 RepID=UPI00266EDD51|nr:helix-turn-helix domain-containing protein [Riemerella columbina]WKS95100.1 helix-turn-helix domain-containing protein [Riemerella columbina]
MKDPEEIRILSNFEYKRLFLPNITEEILNNRSNIQLYRLEFYLRDILIPVKPYRTTFNFLLFVTKGYIKQHSDGEAFTVNAGEFLYIRQGSITATLEIDSNAKGYFLIYENEVYSHPNFALNPSKLSFIPPYFNSQYIGFSHFIKTLELMEYELLISHYRDNEIVRSYLHIVLPKMLQQTDKYPKNISRAMEVSFQFRNLLYEYHKEEKKVLFYADKMGVTENYLNKCLKEVTGKSPKQWINEVDINHSKHLLQGDKTIAEIAYELNFQTPSHFA